MSVFFLLSEQKFLVEEKKMVEKKMLVEEKKMLSKKLK